MSSSIEEVVRHILCRISGGNNFLSPIQVSNFLNNSTNLKSNGILFHANNVTGISEVINNI